MIIEEINKLRQHLDSLIISKAPYVQIYSVSSQIDELLVDYYKQETISKNLA